MYSIFTHIFHIIDNAKYKDYYKLCVIRSSYDRVCSLYFNRHLNIQNEKNFSKLTNSDTFVDMLNQIESDTFLDFHYKKQIIKDNIDKYVNIDNFYDEFIQIANILQFEQSKIDLINDFKIKNLKRESFKKKNYEMDLSNYNFLDDPLNLNISNKTIPDYSNMLNPYTRQKIYNYYKKEIDYFNFT